jgi:5S rRNA maturation endonuclease (ribonuclease M5)
LDGFAYKRIEGYYEPDENDPIEFPFIVELFLVESSRYERRLNLYPSINLTPSIYSDSFDEEDRKNKIFSFKTNNSNGIEESSHAITEILDKCGFSFDKKKHRKSVNFVFINLISPRIDYRTGGKIKLELKPFGSIAQELYKFCKSSRIKGRNKENDGIGGRTAADNKKQELKYLLEQREYDIQRNSDLKKIDRWTQSTVFYRLRPLLIDSGYSDIDRKYITRIIKEVCEDLGYKRHELGIIAAERAQLYSDWQVFGIGFDRLKDLMEKGTDLLVIEKEGIADVLMEFANSRGIAILNSRGFLTEYATELTELAEQKRCNIAILTDWDSSGLLISSNLPNAHRIGIDIKTLERFRLRKEDVEEKVIQKKETDNHLENLKKLSPEQIPSPYTISEWNQMIKYLESKKRIEIDSVIARVGSQRFWDFIIKELDIVFPNRNYNRSIQVPEYILPKRVDDLIINIQNKISKLQSEERQKIRNRLGKTKGFLYVKQEKGEIENSLRSIAEDKINEIMQFISDELKFSFEDNNKKSHHHPDIS